VSENGIEWGQGNFFSGVLGVGSPLVHIWGEDTVLLDAVKVGFDFLGWCRDAYGEEGVEILTDEDFEAVQSTESGSENMVDERHREVYAKWSVQEEVVDPPDPIEPPDVTDPTEPPDPPVDEKKLVSFDKMGGTGGADSVRVPIGGEMPWVAAPTKDLYDFWGYYDAESGGVQYYTQYMGSARRYDKVTDSTLYARWARWSSNMTLDLNGGEWTDGSTGSRMKKVDYLGDLPDLLSEIDLSQGDFVGFYDTANIEYYDSMLAPTRLWDKKSGGILKAKWR
ncbi:MAG: InlB B-repeat-containing protein, partial [Firmicutes bacterium]|nr:InlB B-repeat-containing protein [Bacillota bacterium]